PEYLGPYRVGETLGKGGMGSVFKAQHAKSGDVVAVKLIALQVSDDIRFRRRFNAEIDTLKRLSHPNIVKPIGYGEEQGQLFYSMEFVPGDTLQAIIHRDKKLPWMRAIEIAIQVCSALKHAHDIGVIHRDLKPANLIVKEDGTVKLLDFGISKIFGNDQTAVGSIMGTADYMSPEQANETGITARTDLFQLGCVIYSMLCGKPPFRGKNITEVMAAVVQRDPVPLDMIDPTLPDDVVQIVNELLEKRPEDRPPTALAVMNRLKAMRAGLQRMQTLANEPKGDSKIDADPMSTDDTTRKRVRQSKGDDFDTTTGPEGKSTADPSPSGVQNERGADTVPFATSGDSAHTALNQVDPSAITVHTDGRGGTHRTVAGTALTAPLKDGPDDASAKTDGVDASVLSDTSPGLSGKTHFQTVSDGEVRESYFSAPKSKAEHPVARTVTIVALSLILLVGGAFLLGSLRGPTAEELLATIDDRPADQQAYQIQNAMERFVKLYPDHPRAEDVRLQQVAFRVEAAVRRLRLKAKLRTSEPPLYEQSFLDAMDLRSSDPVAAREKLERWIDVFKDSSMDDEDEQMDLAELARFESDRLASLIHEGDALPNDPKLAELMQRVENASRLPKEERIKRLQGILDLYDGQPWAQPARDRAAELLDHVVD
ncbi:MAG: serine/threonine protein kinase, partial [Planctomycetales bacterium]|nr:serine/threonine protein kinase [Planctomycetales bacterium]